MLREGRWPKKHSHCFCKSYLEGAVRGIRRGRQCSATHSVPEAGHGQRGVTWHRAGVGEQSGSRGGGKPHALPRDACTWDTLAEFSAGV